MNKSDAGMTAAKKISHLATTQRYRANPQFVEIPNRTAVRLHHSNSGDDEPEIDTQHKTEEGMRAVGRLAVYANECKHDANKASSPHGSS